MTDTAAPISQTLPSSQALPRTRDMATSFLFSSTLLSTIHLNKLVHLILSALVYEQNQLFGRAMLYLHNPKTSTLQGMLGICQEDATALHIVDKTEGNPLTGHWELDNMAMEEQRQSEFCRNVRASRIDLGEGCGIIARVVQERIPCRISHVECLECHDCGFIRRFDMKTFAVAPLATRDRLVGIIIVDNPLSDAPIGDEQLQLLQLFANQSGMALENSRLYRNLEETHAELLDARQRLMHGAHLAALGEMAASLSHELKTPLVTIGGFAARLGKLLEPDTTQRHYLDTIISEVQRLEHLLGDVLAYSRKPTICYNRCDLREVIRESIEDYAIAFEEQGIKCHLMLPDGYWDVLGDANQLKQVFINLLVNAQEAMPNGGELWLSLSRDDTENRRRWLCWGYRGGISEDSLSSIFTPFFTTKRRGTGLGLSIVNRIVQNHGGMITASNNEFGAEFRVVLPLAVAPEGN